MTVIAVDANGADLGPAEVAAAARLAAAQGVRVILFGPAGELGAAGGGVEIVDAPLSIAKDPDPVRAVRDDARGLDRAGRAGGRRGPRAGARLQRLDRRRARRGPAAHPRASGVHRPALALTLPVPGRPVTLLDVGANADVRPEILVQFAFMGAAYASAVLGVAAPARRPALERLARPQRGSALVLETHARLAAQAQTATRSCSSATSRATALIAGRRRRGRHPTASPATSR